MSADADGQDVIKALKAQQQVNGVETPAANGNANGNGVHHDHHDDHHDETDGGSASKSRKEEQEAIVEIKDAVLADESFSAANEALTKKMEAAVTALDEAVTAAEEAESKQKEAVCALEEAMSKGDPAPELKHAASAVKEAVAKDSQAESALDEAVLVVGEAVIKNLDRVVSAVDDVVASAPPHEPVIAAPTVEVTPASPQQEEEDITPAKKEAPREQPASAEADTVEAIPDMKGVRQAWFANRQSSEEARREVEEQSRPTISKAAMSTSVDEKSVRAAYEDVRSDTSDTEWAVFKFQDQNIVCSATGIGFDSFRGHFADNERVFGFIRIQMGDEMSKRQKFVFLTWVGPKVSVIRRAKMSIDKAMVKNIVKNFAVELQVESQSEISEEYLRDQLARVGGANYGTGFRD